ncbi:D-aspartate oxidase [Blattella germanica]|nr:D-aspartate oxidase [Blattella germanica]
MPPRIAVIGAGIVGMSTAVLVQEKIPGIDITVISEKFSPHTTGDVAAGLWLPHCLEDTPESEIYRWSSKTYEYMLKLWQSVDAAEAGVCLVSKYDLSNEQERTEVPEWTKIPLAYHTIDRTQAYKLSGHDKYVGGTHMITFTLEPTRYLPYLTKKFKLYGGKVVQRKIERLDDLAGQFDVVINCTGIQAHHLVGDNLIAPVRGQVLRVKAPWIFTALIERSGGGNIVMPNMEDVILGGTHQRGNWNTNPDPKDSEAILQECYRLIPGLKVIHNYGHGGSGITISWGCAHDVVQILQEILTSSLSTEQYKSKL